MARFVGTFVGTYVRRYVDKTIYVPCVNVHDDVVKNRRMEAKLMSWPEGMNGCKVIPE